MGCPPPTAPLLLEDEDEDEDEVVEPPDEEEDEEVVPPDDEDEDDEAGAPLVEDEDDDVGLGVVVAPLPLDSVGSLPLSSVLFVSLLVPRLRVGAALSISEPSTGGGAQATAMDATVPAMTRPIRAKREATIRIMQDADQDHALLR